MSFIVKPVETFTLPLIIKEPTGVAETKEHDLAVTWKLLSKPERKALLKDIETAKKEHRELITQFAAGELEELPEFEFSDIALCEQLITGVDGLLTPDKEEIEYSAELLPELFDMDYVEAAFSAQLGEVLYGKAIRDLLEKN
ncbi:hypothetical protein [Neptuniibacter sp.]|uniref:hypothetical protein n=1 Tax=Neptuniibacter sp. TaxID=1962643 RepID=UPI00261CCC93|nr:hypothetical protein [Neptuniibacter sp.]MCP4595761.1 hypothetical protein [Neptuniibacter sp.]